MTADQLLNLMLELVKAGGPTMVLVLLIRGDLAMGRELRFAKELYTYERQRADRALGLARSTAVVAESVVGS